MACAPPLGCGVRLVVGCSALVAGTGVNGHGHKLERARTVAERAWHAAGCLQSAAPLLRRRGAAHRNHRGRLESAREVRRQPQRTAVDLRQRPSRCAASAINSVGLCHIAPGLAAGTRGSSSSRGSSRSIRRSALHSRQSNAIVAAFLTVAAKSCAR
jgi:hypothetical protein